MVQNFFLVRTTTAVARNAGSETIGAALLARNFSALNRCKWIMTLPGRKAAMTVWKK